MSEEISFVEILMHVYEVGDKVFQDYLENEIDCFDKSWEECSEEIPEVKVAQVGYKQNRKEAEAQGKKSWLYSSLAHDPDTLIIKPLTGFSFRFFGQSFDEGYSSGLEWETHEMGACYVFGDEAHDGWLENLKKLGQEILADKKAMNHPRADKVVRFVTLWSYSTWQDSYNQEWDSKWELLGVVNPKDVRGIINDKEVQRKEDLLSTVMDEDVF